MSIIDETLAKGEKTVSKMSKSPNYTTKGRMLFASAIIVVVGFAALIIRLFQLQIVDAEEYQRKAASQQLRVTEISASRGYIYDRNNNVLAMSSTAWTVCVSPLDIENETQKDLIISGLAEILNLDEDYVREKCGGNTYYKVVKSRIDKATAEEVTTFASNNGIRAINLQEDISRKYPYENFASSVIGFVNATNSGAYGLEAYYNNVLSGTSGKVVSAKNAWGSNMPFGYDELYSSEDGNSIVLTLDDGVQYFVEKHLELAVKEHSVKERGACIVMDAKTGKILAMATKGDFDPNKYLDVSDTVKAEIEALPKDEQNDALKSAQYDQWRNKAISDPYEPGSVFKIITLSAALDSNTTTLGDTFECPGYIMVGDRKISCWKTTGHGSQTLGDAIKNSCNPAFITIGLHMGLKNFVSYFEAFGLSEKTGIDLPGEATSIYHNPDTMSEIDLASSSFGQTFKVTPIQLTTAVCAAVNGGNLYEPYIVEKVVASDGTVVMQKEPNLVRQVISADTSATVCTLLEKVVSEGSGKTARVPGYRIGGKTGTSEKLDQQGDDGVEDYVSSFLAVAPIDDPQIVVLMLLDEAQMENPYGSVVAAPVVGAMLADILPYLGIEPDYTAEELEAMTGKVKNVTDQIVHDAMTVLRMQGYSVNVAGEGATVVKQSPEAGAKLSAGGTITLYTDEELIPKEIEVPNVLGMTVTEVNNAIVGKGLKLKLVGVNETTENQVAYSQNPAAGTMVYPDTVIEVSFTVGSGDDSSGG